MMLASLNFVETPNFLIFLLIKIQSVADNDEKKKRNGLFIRELSLGSVKISRMAFSLRMIDF